MNLTKQDIDWGKQNKTAWGWLTEEQKEILREANRLGYAKRLHLYGKDEKWVDGSTEDFSDIYRIDPAYQPEPEVVKCEIKPDHNDRYVFDYDNKNWGLQIADTFEDFIEWQDEDGNVMPYYRMPSKVKGQPAEIAKYVVFAK